MQPWHLRKADVPRQLGQVLRKEQGVKENPEQLKGGLWPQRSWIQGLTGSPQSWGALSHVS